MTIITKETENIDRLAQSIMAQLISDSGGVHETFIILTLVARALSRVAEQELGVEQAREIITRAFLIGLKVPINVERVISDPTQQ